MLHTSMELPSALYRNCPCRSGAGVCEPVMDSASWGGEMVKSYSSAAILLFTSKWVSDRLSPAAHILQTDMLGCQGHNS